MKLKQITACLVAATFFGSNPAFAQTSKVSGDAIKIGVQSPRQGPPNQSRLKRGRLKHQS